MKCTRQEKQEMIDEVNGQLKMLGINHTYPKEEKVLARILIAVMEVEFYD